MRSLRARAFLLGGWAAALALSACGQLPSGPREGTADIFGVFKDQNGRGVEGVKVRIINTTIIQDAVSDTAGAFRIEEVTPGAYDMNIYTPANYRLANSQQASAPLTIIEGQTLRPEIAMVQAPGTPAAPSVAYVEIYNNFYRPGEVRIKAGSEVTWQNLEVVQHSVYTELDNTLRSGNLSRNQRFSFRFTTPGKYPYRCILHDQMFGDVIVE
jgi:plastocyanin